jgi:hypothetical protein
LRRKAVFALSRVGAVRGAQFVSEAHRVEATPRGLGTARDGLG